MQISIDKMFLSINSVYIGKFDFFQEIVNLDLKCPTQYFPNQKYRDNRQFDGRQMPPVFEVSTFKLIIEHVCAYNFLLDLHNARF